MKLSKNIDSENMTYPLTLDDKIEIFIDRVKGWQLDIAEFLIENNPDSGFATLSIVLSYFEMIGKYLEGYQDVYCSRYHFEIGVRESIIAAIKDTKDKLLQATIFNFLQILYKGGRNGIYHVGMTDRRIMLSGEKEKTFEFANFADIENLLIIINPKILVKHIKKHFNKYEEKLRNSENGKTRENFEKRFDFEQKELELDLIDLVKLRDGKIELPKERRC